MRNVELLERSGGVDEGEGEERHHDVKALEDTDDGGGNDAGDKDVDASLELEGEGEVEEDKEEERGWVGKGCYKRPPR